MSKCGIPCKCSLPTQVSEMSSIWLTEQNLYAFLSLMPKPDPALKHHIYLFTYFILFFFLFLFFCWQWTISKENTPWYYCLYLAVSVGLSFKLGCGYICCRGKILPPEPLSKGAKDWIYKENRPAWHASYQHQQSAQSQQARRKMSAKQHYLTVARYVAGHSTNINHA